MSPKQTAPPKGILQNDDNLNATIRDIQPMKHPCTLAILLVALTALAGCASPRKGPAYTFQHEFRQQLAESVPVKKWGYTIKDLRFTEDFEKAWVVFAPPKKGEDEIEVKLEHDGFRRYRGEAHRRIVTEQAPGAGGLTDGVRPMPMISTAIAPITVTLPAREP
jgi:hypothetical protein